MVDLRESSGVPFTLFSAEKEENLAEKEEKMSLSYLNVHKLLIPHETVLAAFCIGIIAIVVVSSA